ncbi:MAG: ACP S-malonyltransferase, partial [Burkholderiaceae bacterium]|nr:ACP S-malonyltransferase [Burkholderiaceae bacterium]
NSPGQVVIAGAKEAVEKACVEAKALGAKRGLMLPVSVPSHSSMLKPASDALRAKLAEVEMAEPTVDVVANIDVVAHKDVAEIREALAQQVSGAVQWVKTIKSFEEMGVTHIVEVGPGRVLNGLIKRIAPSIEVKNINSQESLNAVFEELK